MEIDITDRVDVAKVAVLCSRAAILRATLDHLNVLVDTINEAHENNSPPEDMLSKTMFFVDQMQDALIAAGRSSRDMLDEMVLPVVRHIPNAESGGIMAEHNLNGDAPTKILFKKKESSDE